ncbi:uncharacterized protein N7487_012009 [Penicillium crustosum]|uniref:uncharacterized protein n=1 Tax=Penicillium crustosum TaxID=36656 RepID=UPI00238DB183|nr:uncharacterized protein N7487_012009 [Penicillium crustosum]KAJ5394368.1 hypothetical protein N7487_012009 [Penicillium crustosum]
MASKVEGAVTAGVVATGFTLGDAVATADILSVTSTPEKPIATFTRTQGTTVVVISSTTSETPSSSNPSATASSTATDSPTSATPSSGFNESTTSSERSESTSSGLSAGASAGIGVGVALGVLVLVFVLFFLYRRRQKHRGLARGDNIDQPVLSELGTDGQKHELPAEESRRAELDANETKPNNTHAHELE